VIFSGISGRLFPALFALYSSTVTGTDLDAGIAAHFANSKMSSKDVLHTNGGECMLTTSRIALSGALSGPF